jgi:hypothetical protein
MSEPDLKKEAEQATKLLRGKTVREVWRHRRKEVGIEFTDGARLFVDCNDKGAEMSITEEPIPQMEDGRRQRIDDSENEVIVKLTQSEALVLFDLCSRFRETDKLAIKDQAEERALWNLVAVLVKDMLEPLQPEYRKRVDEAREKLRDKE